MWSSSCELEIHLANWTSREKNLLSSWEMQRVFQVSADLMSMWSSCSIVRSPPDLPYLFETVWHQHLAPYGECCRRKPPARSSFIFLSQDRGDFLDSFFDVMPGVEFVWCSMRPQGLKWWDCTRWNIWLAADGSGNNFTLHGVVCLLPWQWCGYCPHVRRFDLLM